MATPESETIGIKGCDTETHPGTLHSICYSPSERSRRAGKLLAICWGVALITLFIPFAHFFLVPIFLIAGPIAAYSRYNLTKATERATGICPVCQQEITISLDPTDKIPKHTYCPACNKPLQLVYHNAALKQ